MILPVTFHTSSQSTGQSRSAPPAEFRALLHSVKTPTAHWVFLAVLLGTNTFEILAISSSDIYSRKAAFRLPCASLLLFREQKSWSSMTTTLSDVRSAQIRRDETTLSDAQTRARFSSVQATSSKPTGGPSTCMLSVILHNPSGYAFGFMQYFAHIRGRHLVGVLLLLHGSTHTLSH